MAIRKVGLVAVAVAVIVFLVPACNTLRGMGKDVEKTGEKIQEVAS
jgi:predicted small secreted protein